jgi:hypothetical protein
MGSSCAKAALRQTASPRHSTSGVRSRRAHRDLCCDLILGHPSRGKRIAKSSAGRTPFTRSQHDRCVLARLPHSLCEVLHIRQNAAPCTRASWRVLARCWARGRECRVEIASAPDLLAVSEGGRCPNRLEPISKSFEEDDEAGKLDKAEEIVGVVLPANEDPALPLNPGEEALDEPASHVAA